MIAKHLRMGRKLTPLQALSLDVCMRLAARIAELKEQGMKIDTHIKTVRTSTGKARVAEYKLRASK
jgi:Lhr-like helicase